MTSGLESFIQMFLDDNRWQKAQLTSKQYSILRSYLWKIKKINNKNSIKDSIILHGVDENEYCICVTHTHTMCRKKGVSMNEIVARNIVQTWRCYVVWPPAAIVSSLLFIGILTPRLLSTSIENWRPSPFYSISSYSNDIWMLNADGMNECLLLLLLFFHWQYLKTDNNILWLYILIHIFIVRCSSFIVHRLSFIVCCSFVVRVLGIIQ